MKAHDLDAGVRQHARRAIHVSRRDKTGIRDEQGPFEAELAGKVAQPCQRIGAKDHPSTELEIERREGFQAS